MALFAAIRSRSPAWDDTRAMEEQSDWRAHADFMDVLHEDGFVLLVGPLEGTRDVLLIVRAENAEEVRRRLDRDPWSERLLTVTQLAPWTLRLGSLGPRSD